MELSRGDGSLATFLGVQAGLAMRSIAMLGSEEQKQRWLPPMARLEKIGAFALTEPDHGSDSIALETTARRDGDSYVLNGHKKWIGNGSIADVVVVWARDVADGQVKGFLVEKGTPGYRARVIEGKGSLRAVWQAEIELDELRVPAANKLPGAESFRNTAAVLASTRVSCAWAALGHAVAGYDAALTYAKRRTQFGKPLVSFQLIQNRLVKMLAKVTAMQLYCRRLADLELGRRGGPDAGRAGQGAQHQHRPRGARRGPGPAGRQRHPARLPRHPAHDRHRVHPHLRGHRVHADADRRPRHHRRLRLRLSRHPPRHEEKIMNLARILDEAARMYPDRPAVRLDELVLTYRQLDELSAPRGGLAARARVAPGDRVGIMLPNVAAVPGALLRRAARRRHRGADEPAAQGAARSSTTSATRGARLVFASAAAAAEAAAGRGRGRRRGRHRRRRHADRDRRPAARRRRSPPGPTTTPR